MPIQKHEETINLIVEILFILILFILKCQMFVNSYFFIFKIVILLGGRIEP